MRLAELARVLGATLDGDGELEISGVMGIEDASAGHLTFIANPKYAPQSRTTKASAILVNPDFPAIPTATLRTSNPYLAFAHAVGVFYKPPPYAPGIHPTAVVDATATVGRDAHIGAYVVVGPGAVIGDDATLLPHVVIYPLVKIGDNFFAHAHAVVRESCRIGDNVLLQNGVIIGSDGFGFAKDDAGRWQKIPQSGPVVIGDDVEVQANSCIDRASVGETRIKRGAKIDNLAQVGHGSTVGEDTLICAQVGLAGSTHVGNRVILAGQVGVAGHCHIGDGVVAMAQSGLHGDIEPGKVLGGSPAFDSRQWMKVVAIYRRLPELIKELQREIKQRDSQPDPEE
ncbi:MAG TPA: UDP-3-O-(3-hydroxymyristoyl)glucosamine N-acyltransferase [Acidisarcina sp.]